MRPLLALAGAVLLLAGPTPAASAMLPDPMPEPSPVLPLPPRDEGCVLSISSLQPCAEPRWPQPLRSCVVPVFDPDGPVVPCPSPRRFDEGRIVPLTGLLVERGVVDDAPAQRP